MLSDSPQTSKLNRHSSREWLASTEDAADPQSPHQLTPAAGGVPESTNARPLDGDMYARRLPPQRCSPCIVVVQWAPVNTADLLILSASSNRLVESRNLQASGEKRPCTHLLCARMRLGGSQKRRSDVRLMSAPTTPLRQMTVVCNGGCIGSVSDKPEGVGAVCAVRRVWGEDVPLAGYGSKGVLLSHARRATGLFLLWARSPMSDAGGGGVWMGVLCKRRQWSGVELAGAARCCG
jgi:hypothetical protein